MVCRPIESLTEKNEHLAGNIELIFHLCIELKIKGLRILQMQKNFAPGIPLTIPPLGAQAPSFWCLTTPNFLYFSQSAAEFPAITNLLIYLFVMVNQCFVFINI